MVILIDNYDSFSYNLMQAVGDITPFIEVIRNDAITIQQLEEKNPSHVIISPGPGYPKFAGISEEVIRCFAGKCPILGVCLGHQAICEVYGAKISHAKQLMHGKQSTLCVTKKTLLFQGLSKKIQAARYHSLVADPETMPTSLQVIAVDEKNQEIMAVEHCEHPVFGVQFHPESILTPKGNHIIKNFLKMT